MIQACNVASWIVLDPQSDQAIASGFMREADAEIWLALSLQGDGDTEMLKRCVIAPFDPQRDH